MHFPLAARRWRDWEGRAYPGVPFVPKAALQHAKPFHVPYLLRAAFLLLAVQNAPSPVNAAKRSRGAKRSSGGVGGGVAAGCGLGGDADFNALLAAAARSPAGGATATACLERAVSLEPLRPEGYRTSPEDPSFADTVPPPRIFRLQTRQTDCWQEKGGWMQHPAGCSERVEGREGGRLATPPSPFFKNV